MSIVPLAHPPLPILWHNAVVDVEPTSQYGLDRDLTSINSTICYANESGGPFDMTLFAPSSAESECNVRRQSRERPVHQESEALDLRRYEPAIRALGNAAALSEILAESARHYVAPVTLETGRQVVRFHTRIPIVADAEGTFRFSISVPMNAEALASSRPLSIIVLLPNEAPEFRVEVLDWSAKQDAVVYGSGENNPIAGRPVVSWLWSGEPFASVAYRYRRD